MVFWTEYQLVAYFICKKFGKLETFDLNQRRGIRMKGMIPWQALSRKRKGTITSSQHSCMIWGILHQFTFYFNLSTKPPPHPVLLRNSTPLEHSLLTYFHKTWSFEDCWKHFPLRYETSTDSHFIQVRTTPLPRSRTHFLKAFDSVNRTLTIWKHISSHECRYFSEFFSTSGACYLINGEFIRTS